MRLIILNLILFAPVVVLAQGYVPLVGIPGVAGNNFDQYINALYGLAISIAALLAVIKIIIAGVKWMMTDVVTSKGDAKKDIQGAILGLLVVLAAVLILFVINPSIGVVNLSFQGNFIPPPTPPTPQQQAQQWCSNVTNQTCTVYPCDASTPNSAACNSADTACLAPGATLQRPNNQYLVCIAPPTTTGAGTTQVPGMTTNTISLSSTGVTGAPRYIVNQYAPTVPGYIEHSAFNRPLNLSASNGARLQYEQNCQSLGGTNVTYINDANGLSHGWICTS